MLRSIYLKEVFKYFTILQRRSYHGVQSTSKKHQIDLRSDTLTKPSAGMLDAMMQAKVGDDVYKEDPTVNLLEETCAALFGMESALFVPTGTMGNLLCIMSHIQGRGEELIIGCNQHVHCYEQGHFMQLAGVPARVIPNQADGTLLLSDIQYNLKDDSDFHSCQTKLICLENTHMRLGGLPLPLGYVEQVAQLARANDVKLHIDGARIFNAAVADNLSLKDLLVGVDSVSMCLSKGLGCPIGSVIGGSRDLLKRALRSRKMVGGGMRQSGFLAAAGLYALQNARDTLHADHVKAHRLAYELQKLARDHLSVDINNVRTNIVFVGTEAGKAENLVEKLAKHNILCSAFDCSTVRFVTHCDVSLENIDQTLEVIKDVTAL